MRLAQRLARLRLIRPAWRLADHYFESEDPWHSVAASVPASLYGSGAAPDFQFYLEGPSDVSMPSLDAICEWLLGCQYADDEELFAVPDFWQHPRTFEQIRRGDCEDFALWTWRKVRDLGLRAELVAGRWRQDLTDDFGGHVWVVVHHGHGASILDGVRRSKERMLQPLDSVKELYEPHASIDTALQRRLYAGYVRYFLERRKARSNP